MRPCRALQVQLVVLRAARAGRQRAEGRSWNRARSGAPVHLLLDHTNPTWPHEGIPALTSGQRGQLQPHHAPAYRQRRRRPAEKTRAEGGDAAAQRQNCAVSQPQPRNVRYCASKIARATTTPSSKSASAPSEASSQHHAQRRLTPLSAAGPYDMDVPLKIPAQSLRVELSGVLLAQQAWRVR